MVRLALGWKLAMFTMLAVALPARAEEPGDDDALIRSGVELRRAGRDQEALEVFRSAYRMRPTARALGQMGFAEQALGRWVDAARDLDGSARDATDPWVAKNAISLAQALANVEKHVGRLQVLGMPEGATVTVDDQEVGKLPMPGAVRVPAGEVVISVAALGYITINRKVTIVVGQTTRETIVLHDTKKELAESSLPARAAPQTADSPPGLVAQPSAVARENESPPSSHRSLRLAAWATAGVGMVALATGFLENASYLSKRSDFDGGLAAGPCGTALANRGAAGCSSLYNDMQSAKTTAIIGFAVAGAAGVSSAILFTLAARAPDESSRRLACSVAGASVGCRLSF